MRINSRRVARGVAKGYRRARKFFSSTPFQLLASGLAGGIKGGQDLLQDGQGVLNYTDQLMSRVSMYGEGANPELFNIDETLEGVTSARKLYRRGKTLKKKGEYRDANPILDDDVPVD